MAYSTLTNLGTDYYDISPDEITAYGVHKFITMYGLINDTTLVACTGIDMTIGRVEITTYHFNREKTRILNEDGNWIYIPFYPKHRRGITTCITMIL